MAHFSGKTFFWSFKRSIYWFLTPLLPYRRTFRRHPAWSMYDLPSNATNWYVKFTFIMSTVPGAKHWTGLETRKRPRPTPASYWDYKRNRWFRNYGTFACWVCDIWTVINLWKWLNARNVIKINQSSIHLRAWEYGLIKIRESGIAKNVIVFYRSHWKVFFSFGVYAFQYLWELIGCYSKIQLKTFLQW